MQGCTDPGRAFDLEHALGSRRNLLGAPTAGGMALVATEARPAAAGAPCAGLEARWAWLWSCVARWGPFQMRLPRSAAAGEVRLPRPRRRGALAAIMRASIRPSDTTRPGWRVEG